MSDYLLVTNFWNEAGNLRPFIENIAKQTKRPVDWLFIDDGSPEEANDEAQTEIQNAGEDFGIIVHYTYTFPMKDKGNKLTIGRAWNVVLPWIKDIRTDYLAVADCDTRYDPNYFADLTEYLDIHQDVGAAAGCVEGEKRSDHMPMGGGKVIRWQVIESISEFWDLEPDSFFNIKSMALGYRNKSLDIPVGSRPTTPRIGLDLAYRLQYCGNSVLTAFFKALKCRDRDILTHFIFLRRNGAHQTDDPDARYYYSKRRILKSLFKGKGVMR